MRVAVHQPNFLPRLKVLQKISAADVWVVLDSVQYCQREWQNRARIVTVHGNCCSFWLTIPVHLPDGQRTLIREVTIVDPVFTMRLVRRSLVQSLRRAPHWKSVEGVLKFVDATLEYESLTRFCVETTSALLDAAGVKPEIIYSSSLPVTGKASVLMAAICAHLHADEYLADSGAKGYLREDDFKGVEVLWQQWQEPAERWPGINEWRNMSAINYLCREGPDQFRTHIIGGRFVQERQSRIAGQSQS